MRVCLAVEASAHQTLQFWFARPCVHRPSDPAASPSVPPRNVGRTGEPREASLELNVGGMNIARALCHEFAVCPRPVTSSPAAEPFVTHGAVDVTTRRCVANSHTERR